jgi:hypothetical protein
MTVLGLAIGHHGVSSATMGTSTATWVILTKLLEVGRRSRRSKSGGKWDSAYTNEVYFPDTKSASTNEKIS